MLSSSYLLRDYNNHPGGIRVCVVSDVSDAVPSSAGHLQGYATTYHLGSHNQLTVLHLEMTSMTNEIARDEESRTRLCNLSPCVPPLLVWWPSHFRIPYAILHKIFMQLRWPLLAKLHQGSELNRAN